MRITWQLFLGGKVMFWLAIIIFAIFAFGFTITYLVDPTTTIGMRIQNIDTTSIKEVSEKYVSKLRNYY